MNLAYLRKLTISLILAASVACRSHKGVIIKQWYEPPQTIQYLNKSGTKGRTVDDDADFCLEVTAVAAADKKGTHTIYLDFDRWHTSHIGDTISYHPADRRDSKVSAPWK